MTGSRASKIALTCALIAACTTGGPGGDYGQIRQGANPGAFITPITCPDMFPSGFGDTCTTLSMNSGAQATAATYSVISIDHSNASQASGVLKEAGQTFHTNRAGHPGGIGVILRLVSDTNLTTTDWDMIVDMVDIGLSPGNGHSTVVNVPGGRCSSGLSTIARGRYNTKLLTFGVDSEARINFSTTAEVVLIPERQYGVIFHMEPPGINNVGIAANDQSADFYPQGNAMARQMRLLSIDSQSGAACYSNPPFVADKIRDMNFYLTLDDGCVVGATYSCSRGACFRTIPECDTYGNFNQCHSNYCTTDADCVLDWNHPERGTLPTAVCNNPTGLDYQGTCVTSPGGLTTFPETCNGVDDDCNGSTDEGLANTTCGVGACTTTVYSCDTYVDNDTMFTEGRPAVCQPGQPSGEQCDNIDNDCDGQTDDDRPQTDLCGSGPCRRSVYSCILAPNPGAGTPATCTPDLTLASSEQCNGFDDDCDEYTDDVGGPQPSGPFRHERLYRYYYPTPASVAITLPNYYPPAFMPQPPPVRTDLDPTARLGQCHYGHQLCAALAESGVAIWDPDALNPWVTPVAENYPANNIYVCDGLDNDCDGYTDNVPGTTAAMTRIYWPNSVATDWPTAIRNTGRCQDGVETCMAGLDNTSAPDENTAGDRLNWRVTTGTVLPTNEACNGLDDNCDGTADEVSALGQQLCGKGVCQTVVNNCSFVTGNGWTTLGASCGGGTNAGNTNLISGEACNGLDDDCEGYTDNYPNTTASIAVTCHPLCDAFNAAHPGSGTVCQYPAGNAQGACRYGLQLCITGSYQACGTLGAQTEIAPVSETCNDVDDDCDGIKDNLSNSTTAIKVMCSPGCSAWGGLCQPNVGQCRPGTATCATGGNVLTAECAATEVGPSTDRCNGFDDDCDAYSDNVPGTNTKIATSTFWSCGAFTGCVSGNSTTLTVGQCRAGTSGCGSIASPNAPGVSTYGASISTPVGPSTEICNQLDDDCDIAVDNKVGQSSYTLQQTCSSQCSSWASNNPTDDACVASAIGTGQCRNGTQTCNVGGWGGCPTSGGLAEIGPSVEQCNGLDDDCDGRFDNAVGTGTLSSTLSRGDVCQNGCDAWTVGNGKASNCVPNAGQCRKGTGTCNAASGSGIASWGGCFGEVVPTSEICNGVDDDCDIYTDTVPGTPLVRLSTGSSWSCTGFGTSCKTYGTLANQTTATTLGQCRVGTQQCSSGSYSQQLDAPTGPSADACNGFDDDCDGASDNYMNSTTKLATATAWNCNSLPGCNATVATGACRAGTSLCAGGPGAASYSNVTLVPYNASGETCNGVDDDCEGATDNYPGSSTKLQTAAGWSCNSIAGCHNYGTLNNTATTTAFAYGACKVGTSSCSGAAYSLALSPSYNASADSCNGLDDDCDGYTDNTGNQVNTQLKTATFWSCSGFPGCISGNALLLAAGQCRAGTGTCSGVSGYTTTTTAVGPSVEACDAVDNDCDGQTDNNGGNGTTTKLSTNTYGTICWNSSFSCYGGSNLCKVGTSFCAGAGGYTTVSVAPVGPSTDTCNGFDDDCDGATDNATAGNPTKLATATYWSCSGYTPNAAGTGNCATGVATRGQCRAGTNTCGGAGGYTTAGTSPVGPSYEVCNGLDDDCTAVNDDGVEVMNGSQSLCVVQNNTPGSAGYQVSANVGVVNSVNPPCVSGTCGVAARRFDVVTSPLSVGWFGGCVSGYYDANSSYADGCECTDDQFATTNTVPAGCTSANSDCATKSTVTCEFGQDLCSVPGATGCSGGFMGGGANAVANTTSTATAKGQIPNQVFRDYYYVKLGRPNFPASGSRGVQPPSESLSVDLSTNVTPSSTNSQVFFMRVFPYGSFTDAFNVARNIQSPMGLTTTNTYQPGAGTNGCSNIMSQVLGNGATQGLGVFTWQANSIAAAATFDLTHYTWTDNLCPADGSAGTPSWCSQNTTWPNWLVVEVRRTSWAGTSNAPWEWVPGSGSGHGPSWGGNNQSAQSVGPGCGSGVMSDSNNCRNGLISTGTSPAMPANYYTLSLNYTTGANP